MIIVSNNVENQVVKLAKSMFDVVEAADLEIVTRKNGLILLKPVNNIVAHYEMKEKKMHIRFHACNELYPAGKPRDKLLSQIGEIEKIAQQIWELINDKKQKLLEFFVELKP